MDRTAADGSSHGGEGRRDGRQSARRPTSTKASRSKIGSVGRNSVHLCEQATPKLEPAGFLPLQFLDVSQLRRQIGRPRDHQSKAHARVIHLVGLGLIEVSWMACFQ